MHPALACAIMEAMDTRMSEFNPQNTANSLWALAILGLSPPPALLQDVCATVVRRIRDFTPQNLVSYFFVDCKNLCWLLHGSVNCLLDMLDVQCLTGDLCTHSSATDCMTTACNPIPIEAETEQSKQLRLFFMFLLQHRPAVEITSMKSCQIVL